MYKKIIIIVCLITLISSTSLFAESLQSNAYVLKNPSISAAGGDADSASFSLNNVALGVFGGKVGSANYILHAGFINCASNTSKLSIELAPDACSLENIPAGQSAQIQKIVVKNIGNINISSLGLQAIDSTSTPWTLSETPDNNELNNFVMHAAFTETNINEVDDSVFTQMLAKAGDGLAIAPGKAKALWLKFTAPRVDTTGESQHDLWLVINAKEVN